MLGPVPAWPEPGNFPVSCPPSSPLPGCECCIPVLRRKSLAERASNAAGVAGVEVQRGGSGGGSAGRRQWGWRCREEAVFSRLVVPESSWHSLLYLVSSAQVPPMRLRLRETKGLSIVTYSQRQMESRPQLSCRQEIEDG